MNIQGKIDKNAVARRIQMQCYMQIIQRDNLNLSQQNSIKIFRVFLNVKFASPNEMDSCEARENLLVRRGSVVVMSLRLFPKKKISRFLRQPTCCYGVVGKRASERSAACAEWVCAESLVIGAPTVA
jgi:hypothetical protein